VTNVTSIAERKSWRQDTMCIKPALLIRTVSVSSSNKFVVSVSVMYYELLT